MAGTRKYVPCRNPNCNGARKKIAFTYVDVPKPHTECCFCGQPFQLPKFYAHAGPRGGGKGGGNPAGFVAASPASECALLGTPPPASASAETATVMSYFMRQKRIQEITTMRCSARHECTAAELAALRAELLRLAERVQDLEVGQQLLG